MGWRIRFSCCVRLDNANEKTLLVQNCWSNTVRSKQDQKALLGNQRILINLVWKRSAGSTSVAKESNLGTLMFDIHQLFISVNTCVLIASKLLISERWTEEALRYNWAHLSASEQTKMPFRDLGDLNQKSFTSLRGSSIQTYSTLVQLTGIDVTFVSHRKEMKTFLRSLKKSHRIIWFSSFGIN